MVTARARPSWAGKVEELLTAQRKTKRWLAVMMSGELATGMSESYLNKLMSGDRGAKKEHIAAMAKTLGVPLHWLVADEPQLKLIP